MDITERGWMSDKIEGYIVNRSDSGAELLMAILIPDTSPMSTISR
jgi:hypothetical protein